MERFTSREIMLTEVPMWQLVQDFASIALWQRQMAVAHLDQATVYEPAPLAGKRVVVGLDGGRLRLRINKIGSEQTPTRKYATDQCEPKLFAIYTIDDQGNKERKGDVFYDGTLQSAAALFTLLKLRLKQLGIHQARLLVIIGDGASWIWNGVPALRSDLALTHLPVVEIVDWAHAAGKLMPPATVGLPEPKQQQQWFKRMRTLLKQGNITHILDALQALDQRHDTDEVIRTAIHYFQTHDSPYAIRYISSGRSPDWEWEYREWRQADRQPPVEGCEPLLASRKRRRNLVSSLPDQEWSVGDSL